MIADVAIVSGPRTASANRSARFIAAALAIWALAAAASPCAAQVDLLSAQTLHGVVDVRLAAANGEPSFGNGGFGKSRYGGDGGPALKGRADVANATLEWTPRLTWGLSAVVDVLVQPGDEHALDIGQAYLLLKPAPRSPTRFQVRAGLFYPPVSQENDFRAWGVTDTITPSAINTWIGEEVKVVGLEAQVSRAIGDQQVSASAAVFGFDDTSGTLLAYRGWALHDVQSQLNGGFPLPPLPAAIAPVQDNGSYSLRNIDGRAGFYGRAEWRTADGIALNAFYYDNRGDRTSVSSELQWAWATHFTEVGARWDVDDRTRLMAQALEGRTAVGPPDWRLAELGFRSAYVLATRRVGKSAFTVRGDIFDTHDRSAVSQGATSEHGWATTAAWRYPLSKLVDLRLEAMRISSDRPGRVLADEPAIQNQTVLQSSLRLSF